MRSSPRRPLILKRRRLNLPHQNASNGTDMPNQSKTSKTELAEHCPAQKFRIHEPFLHGSSHRLQISEPTLQSSIHGLDVSQQGNAHWLGVNEPSKHGTVSDLGLCQKVDAESKVEPSDLSQSHPVNTMEHFKRSEASNPRNIPPSIQSPPVKSVEEFNIPPSVRIVNHPTNPDTQFVVLPPELDVHSIIHALTARGRTNGGPNKFILINGGASFQNQTGNSQPAMKVDDSNNSEMASSKLQPIENVIRATSKKSGELDISLTNINWLGKMSSDGLSLSDVKEEPEEKENPILETECVKMKDESDTLPPQKCQFPESERPPYSYMALIQFAINSTPSKRMTLKDIYTWIEDHFPFFKHVAKPGWKNSIRHNLSLHDMFVRETMTNKISYWTIHPQSNRCLTLDQMFKATSPTPPLPLESQKRSVSEITNAQSVSFSNKEKKMKPLLPRVSSYLIPVHFPVTQSILVPALESLNVDLRPSEEPRSSKCVKLPPLLCGSYSSSESGVWEPTSTEEDPVGPIVFPIKEESVEPEIQDFSLPPNLKIKKMSCSRRKQLLITPHTEEPELVLPESSISDSGLDSEFSFLQETNVDGPSQLTHEEYSFKTPTKERALKPPTSSTPSKTTEMGGLQLWGVESPLPRDTFLEFSPVRQPPGPALTPFKDCISTISFGDTPFRDIPVFGSPLDFLSTLSPPSPKLESRENSTPARPPKRCCKESQVVTSANRSILEGLVLDTTDESLSKIMLDISFTGMEEDNGGGAENVWGQIFSEFK
uniref:Forkhead box protein M1 n=1 Tax=Leptobrachium leishanense TaxID=445787 RepID=A0A8C5N2W0_9ANUR